MPRNVSEVRSFIVLAGFYGKFVRDFFRIAHPITNLRRKGNKLMWSKNSLATFEYLKIKLIFTPILRVPDPKGHFVVIKNASGERLGGVLMQEDQAIAYESRKMKKLLKKIMHHTTWNKQPLSIL